MASIPKRMKMCISKNGGTFYIDYIVSLSGVRAIFRSSDLVVQSVQHHRQQVPAGSPALTSRCFFVLAGKIIFRDILFLTPD